MPQALDERESVWELDLGWVSAYLIDDGTVTLIDSGTPGAGDLRRELDEAGYDATDIDRVLVTHFDLDHVGGLSGLDFDAPVYAMEPDASILDGSNRLSLLGKKGLFHGATEVLLRRPDAEIRRLEDGDTVGKFTAHHTPGHTPGHAVYHHSELEVALLGDLVAGSGGGFGALLGVRSSGDFGGVPWPLVDDNSVNNDSVRKLAERELSFEIACVGHGDPLTSGGDEALDALTVT